MKANHNKDYSVVKTFKAAQVAFLIYFSHPPQSTTQGNR